MWPEIKHRWWHRLYRVLMALCLLVAIPALYTAWQTREESGTTYFAIIGFLPAAALWLLYHLILYIALGPPKRY